jgi:hypothetical protein
VLWPIEPVEPKIANFFTSFIFAEFEGRCWAVLGRRLRRDGTKGGQEKGPLIRGPLASIGIILSRFED